MKGIQGIVIALGLGVLGALCNWFYVAKQARNYETVSFVAIDSQAQINPGDRFTSEVFQRVDIPKRNVKNLVKIGVLWRDRESVVGMAATRSYVGDEILLHQDLKTPAQRDLSHLLGENEALRWVPVDPRAFVPQLVNPEDRVSFIVPVFGNATAPPSTGSANRSSTATQTIGPFEVLSLGTRKGRRELLKARGRSAGKESSIGIRVTIKNGQLDDKSAKLFEVLRVSKNQGVQVMLHSARLKQKS